MRFSRILIALAAIISMSSLGTFASAQTPDSGVEFNEIIGNADLAISTAWYSTGSEGATPEGIAAYLPAASAVIMVMEDEQAAIELMELFREMSPAPMFTLETLDGLGDDAISVESEDTGLAQSIVMARDGHVIVGSFSTGDPTLIQDIVRHILETGPSDNELVDSADGSLTGGWADAFPTADDLEALAAYEQSPIIRLSPIPEAQAETSATPYPAASPAAEGMPLVMLNQIYMDFSDEALASDTRPETVMIMLQEFESEEDADLAMAGFQINDMEVADMEVTEIEEIGESAFFLEQVDEGGDHGATIIVREGNLLLLVFVTGAPESPEIAQDIARYMVETGPSAEELSVDDNGIVTGGWADAFPAPDDVAGVAHFDPVPVMQIEDEMTPVEPVVATPAS